MSDSALDKFYTYGTNAERLAFVPDPPPGVNVLYIWYETDTGDMYIYDGSVWVLMVNALPAGDVTGPASSTDRSLALFNGTTGKVLLSDSIVVTTTSRITNVANPTGAQDVATKSYVDTIAPAVITTNQRMRSFGITVDGGGSVFTTGTKGYIRVPYNGTISKWTLMADTVGNVTVNIYKSTIGAYPPVVANTIADTTPPSLTATYVRETTALPSWTTTVTAGDIFAFNVDTVTTITRATLVVDVTIS